MRIASRNAYEAGVHMFGPPPMGLLLAHYRPRRNHIPILSVPISKARRFSDQFWDQHHVAVCTQRRCYVGL